MLFFSRARRVSASSSGLSSTNRITLFFSIDRFLLMRLQGKPKLRAVAVSPFGPGLSAVPVNDALDDREADTTARELGRPVEALKSTKELVGIGHVEARAVVADEVV